MTETTKKVVQTKITSKLIKLCIYIEHGVIIGERCTDQA